MIKLKNKEEPGNNVHRQSATAEFLRNVSTLSC